MLYLAYVGVSGGKGILLWPAVAVHAGLSVLLVRPRWKEGRERGSSHIQPKTSAKDFDLTLIRWETSLDALLLPI